MNGLVIPPVVIALCLILPGCVTYQAVFGIEATDLSSLHLEMDRAEVEDLLGSPEETGQWDQGTKAHYDYDRGYFGRAEESPGKIVLAPVVLLGEFLIPTMEFIAYCTEVCQEGRLEVLYSKDDQLVAARVTPKNFGRCATDPPTHFNCSFVASRADPSSFPSNLSGFYQRQMATKSNEEFHALEAKRATLEMECLMPFSEALLLDADTQGQRATSCGEFGDPVGWQWLCLAAHNGNPEAQHKIGGFYENGGDPVSQDLDLAYIWYSLAEVNGFKEGGSNMRKTATGWACCFPDIPRREIIAEDLTPAQIREAELRVTEWRPNSAECEVETAATTD